MRHGERNSLEALSLEEAIDNKGLAIHLVRSMVPPVWRGRFGHLYVQIS